MPTYEYRCNECGYELEARQSFSDKPLLDCPECKLLGLERIISGGLMFFVDEDLGPKSTLMRQAIKNTEKMGRYELEDKRKYHEESGNAAHAKALQEAGVVKDYKPFYGKPTVDISKLKTRAQQQKYILEGK